MSWYCLSNSIGPLTWRIPSLQIGESRSLTCIWFHLIYHELFMHLRIKKASQGIIQLSFYPSMYPCLSTMCWFSKHPEHSQLHQASPLGSFLCLSSYHLNFDTRGPEHTRCCFSASPQVGLSECDCSEPPPNYKISWEPGVYAAREEHIKRARCHFTTS